MQAFQVILRVHIVLAVACAITFWLPLIVRKGGTLHRRLGFAYVFFLFLVTATALGLTAVTYLDPEHSRPKGEGLPLDPMVEDRTLYRAFELFLAYVAFATFSAALTGLAALKSAGTLRVPRAAFHGLVAVLGIAVVVAGLRLDQWPMIAVGAAGAVLGAFGARLALRARRDLGTRIQGHVAGMIASGVGAYTALAVVFANRMAPAFFHGRYGLVVWLFPAALGVPFLLLAARFFRRHPERMIVGN